MLNEWLTNGKNTNWSTLADALESPMVGYPNIASAYELSTAPEFFINTFYSQHNTFHSHNNIVSIFSVYDVIKYNSII